MRDSDAVFQTPTGTQSLERAATLLREVASHGNRGARLTDLVKDSGISKATVRRLLAAMIRERLLEQDEETRRYYLGADTLALGTIAAARFGLHNLGTHALSRLAALSHAKYVGNAIPLAALLCDRHKDANRGLAVALVHESAAGHTSQLTYSDLLDHSRRFASVLQALGVSKGDRVATQLPKGPELLIAMMAIWRLGAVYVPLFTAFGRPAVSYRLSHSGSKVVITNRTFRNNLTDQMAAEIRVVIVEGDGVASAHPTDRLFWSSLHSAPCLDKVTTLTEDEPFILIYTSSMIGTPKGIPVPVKALTNIEEHMRLGLELSNDDVYWNLGDPAWAGGLYYGVLGPLLLGHTTIWCDGPFDAGQVYRVLAKHKVTNLLATPSWYQTMRASETVHAVPTGLLLRVASSVGDYLPEDLIEWVAMHLRVPLRDHYGQSETGVLVWSHQALPGSVGRVAPGFRLVILDGKGRASGNDEQGEIAVDTEKSALHWFEGYYNEPASTTERFRFGRRYYLTGDLGRVDMGGNIYYLGKKEDLIKSERYLIAPRQIEDALTSHSAVAEAAAVGMPDRLQGETIKAFVVLKHGFAPSPELAEEIAQCMRVHVPTNTSPPKIEFVQKLPRTAKGKLHRLTLKNNIENSKL